MLDIKMTAGSRAVKQVKNGTFLQHFDTWSMAV